MELVVRFDVDEVQKINFDDYDSDEFAIARLGFLSTRPNSHGLDISEDVLRADAPSVLGKWVVAKMKNGDATTHDPKEVIMGSIPRDQEVEFAYDEDGYLRAYVDAIISKIYAREYCKMFEEDNERAVSVEMKVKTANGNAMNDVVEGLHIVGVTTLGKIVNPSCPQSDISFVRFSEENADAYFAKVHTDTLSTLKNFVKERKILMEEKYVNHPINASKEALYEGDWDGEQAKQDLVKEEKFETLAPKVCLKLEEGWKDRQVTKLGYPVMMLHEGEWVYSRKGLASALGYAKQHGESDVVDKVEAIYKDLDLELDGKEEDAKMSEIEFAESESVENSVEPQNDQAEEQNTQFAEEPKTEDEPKAEVEMSADEMKVKLAEYEATITEKENIIMEKDTLIEELQKFKDARLEADKVNQVETVMSSVAQFMDKETADSYRQEGMSCEFAEIDAWSNKVKASVVDKVTKSGKKDEGFTRMSAPIATEKKKSDNVWDRI